MSLKRIKDAKLILDYMTVVKPAYRQYVTTVSKLYADSKIERRSDAESLLKKLFTRGLGQQKAIEKIKSYELGTYKPKPRKIYPKEPIIPPKKKIIPLPIQTFHVSGTVLTYSVYYWETIRGEKSKDYDKYHDSMKIKAISQEAAITYF